MNHPGRSLAEVNASVDTTKPRSRWRRIAAFFGPAYLVSVGYMDPGNWATDLQGGSLFGYRLVWVLVMSNVMALLLQSLCARLGIVRGRDLAQCNREAYPKGLNFILYVFAELAIAACDLAEVLGMAVGLQLLLGLPLIWGVLITLLDTFLLLYLQKLGMRKMEAFIISLVGIIGVCFLIEMLMAKIDGGALLRGLVPSLPANPGAASTAGGPSYSVALYLTIGIIGATVMPHNLYLHSALVQTRRIGRDEASIRKAIRFNVADSAIALNLALFVNAAILILAAAVFHSSGHHDVAKLKDAHVLLSDLLGNAWASHLFAIALIAAGQSSTVTGTLAGQIVMEGYLHLRINPVMRRLLTRLLAIVPAVLVILLMGEGMVDDMLVFSQVLLSMQLGFAVIPLIHFVSDKKEMGPFAIGTGTRIAVWAVAILLVGLNLWMLGTQIAAGMRGTSSLALKLLLLAAGAALVVLLLITLLYPLLRRRPVAGADSIHSRQSAPLTALPRRPDSFGAIALALDFSDKDGEVIRYALMMGGPATRFVLLHVVESAPAKLSGDDTEDLETRRDREQLESYAKLFADASHTATVRLGFRDRAAELARLVRESGADLLVVGSHGHKGVRDWLFGETINSLRHAVKVPVFIAR